MALLLAGTLILGINHVASLRLGFFICKVGIQAVSKGRVPLLDVCVCVGGGSVNTSDAPGFWAAATPGKGYGRSSLRPCSDDNDDNDIGNRPGGLLCIRNCSKCVPVLAV